VPSSLTHSLQIYCTRLTGPRSNTLGMCCKTGPYTWFELWGFCKNKKKLSI